MDIALRGQFGQRLCALHSSKRHPRFGSWAIVPAALSRQAMSCTRHHAAFWKKKPLSQFLSFHEPELSLKNSEVVPLSSFFANLPKVGFRRYQCFEVLLHTACVGSPASEQFERIHGLKNGHSAATHALATKCPSSA
jgi:hypothetical protein